MIIAPYVLLIVNTQGPVAGNLLLQLALRWYVRDQNHEGRQNYIILKQILLFAAQKP
jgi:hypothetical protein